MSREGRLVGLVRTRKPGNGACGLRALALVHLSFRIEQLHEHARDLVLVGAVPEGHRGECTRSLRLRTRASRSEHGDERHDRARLGRGGLIGRMAGRERPQGCCCLLLGVLCARVANDGHERLDAARGGDGRLVCGMVRHERRQRGRGLGRGAALGAGRRRIEQTDEGLYAPRARDTALDRMSSDSQRSEGHGRLALRACVVGAQQLHELGDRSSGGDGRLDGRMTDREAPECTRRGGPCPEGSSGAQEFHKDLDRSLGCHSRLDLGRAARHVAQDVRGVHLRLLALRAQQCHEVAKAAVRHDGVGVGLVVPGQAQEHLSAELLRTQAGTCRSGLKGAAASQLQDQPLHRARVGNRAPVVRRLGQSEEHARDMLLRLGRSRAKQRDQPSRDRELALRVVGGEAGERADGLTLGLHRA